MNARIRIYAYITKILDFNIRLSIKPRRFRNTKQLVKKAIQNIKIKLSKNDERTRNCESIEARK